MLEKKITPSILRAIRDDKRFGSGFYEAKVAKGKTLYKNQLAEHQRRALELATNGEVYFKIPDCGFQNPCDAVVLKKAQSWLVIYFDVLKAPEIWALKIQDVPLDNLPLDYAREKGIQVYV